MAEKKKEKTVLFENKLINSEKFAKDFTYCDLVLLCLNTIPTEGIKSLDRMVILIETVKTFKQKNNIQVTQLEINEVIKAFDNITEQGWKFFDIALIEFYDYIKKLKEKF